MCLKHDIDLVNTHLHGMCCKVYFISNPFSYLIQNKTPRCSQMLMAIMATLLNTVAFMQGSLQLSAVLTN